VEVPDIEKRRAGLDAALRLWIIFDDFIQERIAGQSFYLEPDPPIGRFSKAFFLPLAREFVARRKSLKAATEHGSHVGAIGITAVERVRDRLGGAPVGFSRPRS
jgi:hypothetical protein